MTLEEFYTSMDVDYQNILDRLMKEERILRYLRMLVEDTTMISLEEAVMHKQYDQAFALAHTMKGVCENLEIKAILTILRPLVEDLRTKDPKTLPGSYEELKEVYHTTIEQIKRIEIGG